MNQLTKVFEGNHIRIVEEQNDIRFVGVDIARSLGYSNPQKALRDHCKGVNDSFIPTTGGIQALKTIPKGDVFRLIVRSKLPSAQRFEEWVFDEVLPELQDKKAYVVAQPEEPPEVIIARGLIAAQEALKRSEQERQDALDRLEAQKPLVAFAEVIEKSQDSLLVRDFAKAISKRGFVIGERRLFQWLRDRKYIDRKNMPYQRFIDQGLFEVTETPVPRSTGIQLRFTSRITAKGQIYFYNKLTQEE